MEIKYSYILVFLAILMFYIQRNRLQFKKIQSFSSLASFNDALQKTANELNWCARIKQAILYVHTENLTIKPVEVGEK